jgi:threonine 3-dehydrogenase
VEALLKTEPERGLTYSQDTPEPELAADEALVEITTTAICGTDVHIYEWDEGAANFPIQFPRIVGHEASGTVRAVGSAVSRVSVGDRVAFETHIPCNHCYACRTGNAHNCENLQLFGIDHDGAFATLATAPESVLFKLPERMSFETGALLEPAGVAMHALQRSGIRPGDTVAVTGCGPIGLLTCKLALIAGASRVLAFDIDSARLEAARDLGVTAINPGSGDRALLAHEANPARGGVDLLVEASGAADVFEWALPMIRREGTLVTVGHPGRPVPIDITQSVNKLGLTIRGSFGRHMWKTWTALAALLEAERIDLEAFITHRFAMPDFDSAFDAIRHGAIKVLLDPSR